MKYFAAAMVGAVSALTETEFAFLNYVTEFGKEYKTIEEYQMRLENFKTAQMEIIAHNESGEHTYTLGHNQFSDWSREEYLSILTHREMPEEDKNFVTFDEALGATHVDWRSKGVVQGIKDQKQCGSCWAFSTVSALESTWAIKHGKLYSLAEQQLVDCDNNDGGCNGGLQSRAFNYYKSHYAVLESNYTYTARNGTCKYSNMSKTSVKTTGYANVTAKSVSQMKSALSSRPLSVSIEADTSAFGRYSSGIFNNSNCGTRLDHATNVVGWGTSGSTDYWIMRNSWGKSWGESGYMRIAIVDGVGICGIQKEPLYPLI